MGIGGIWELRSEALRGGAATERLILARGSAPQLGKRFWKGMETPSFGRRGVARGACFSLSLALTMPK